MQDFYTRLALIEQMLANNFQIGDLGNGLITVNGQMIDTNLQLPMLTPGFFRSTAADNPMVQSFMEFFQNTGILPREIPNIPIIRDIPLRTRTLDPRAQEQKTAFANFLNQDIMPNQWTHIFNADFERLKNAITTNYHQQRRKPLEKKKITQAADGTPLRSGGYSVERYAIDGINLWLRVPASNSQKDIEAAVSRTLNDTENTNIILNHLKPRLRTTPRIAFNVRGVGRPFYTREAIQNTDLGGGHQHFLMLDRATETIYAINNTIDAGSGDEDTLFLKEQIDIFLQSIGDSTQFQLQCISGKSRQPNDQSYLSQVCNVSQFCHYAAILSGKRVGELQETVPAKVTTLLYLIQYAVDTGNLELSGMLQELVNELNAELTRLNVFEDTRIRANNVSSDGSAKIIDQEQEKEDTEIENESLDRNDAITALKQVLDDYITYRRGKDPVGHERPYYYHGLFSWSPASKSFAQKQAAVDALKDALDGDNTNLTEENIATLRNGELGRRLRNFIRGSDKQVKVEALAIVDKNQLNDGGNRIRYFIESLRTYNDVHPRDAIINV